ncbi:hypothetical protein BY458DRAFT_497365 [Sporodiniella umbellata]|nr:hypothetical protein BY458DRAFT_497365 [Sporodiniella umbellata]
MHYKVRAFSFSFPKHTMGTDWNTVFRAKDEDLVMEEDDNSEKVEDISDKDLAAVHYENPFKTFQQFGTPGTDQMDFTFFAQNQSLNEYVMDEKDESLMYGAHLEKMIVHQNFYNSNSKRKINLVLNSFLKRF